MKKIRLFLYFIRLNFVEIVKFDLNFFLLPLSVIIILASVLLFFCRRYIFTIQLLTKFYQFNWPLSESFTLFLLAKVHDRENFSLNNIAEKIYHEYVDHLNYPAVAEKFIADPDKFFPEMCIVLKSHSMTERGVILLKYSYSFPLFLKLFNVEEIAKRYFIILEPSWNGYFNLDILCYNLVKEPVFVQAQEPRDARLLEALGSNLFPVPLGTNWWVDYKVFTPLAVDKDVDIIMVASWANFKRHYKFFKILRDLKRKGKKLRVVLVGYPIEKSLKFIKEQAVYFGIVDQIEFYEWLTPEQVNVQMNRAKINLIWSRYEGNNRVLLEGMFADVPFILREGFNYGYKYPFVNDQTGAYASEKNLANTIECMLSDVDRYSSRKWAIENMSCHIAIEKLDAMLEKKARDLNEEWSRGGMSVKVNELHGMRYFLPNSIDFFDHDYSYLKKSIRSPRNMSMKMRHLAQ